MHTESGKGKLETDMEKWLSNWWQCYQMPTTIFCWPQFSSTMTAGGSLAEWLPELERRCRWAGPPPHVALLSSSTSQRPIASSLPPLPFKSVYFNTSWVLAKTLILSSQGSVQFSCSVMSDSLRPHGLHHARLPCPSPTPRACSDSQHQGLFQWVSSLHQVAQRVGVSASTSVYPMNIRTDLL